MNKHCNTCAYSFQAKDKESSFSIRKARQHCKNPKYNSPEYTHETDEYQIQVQHYMAVTGYKGTYIEVLIGGNTFRWKFIERDEELISMLIKLESDFWNHVQDGTPPPLDGSDASARFLSERFPNSVPKSQITLPDTAADLLIQYDEACEQLDEVTERKRRAENLLKEMLGTATGVCSMLPRHLEEYGIR